MVRALFRKLRGSNVGNQIKDLWMLALPYQVAAVATALVAVGFTKLFVWVEHQNAAFIAAHPSWIFLTAPLAFLFSWWFVARYAPMAGGSGVAQVIAATEVADDAEKNDGSWRFLNVRIIFVRIGATLGMALGGGAIGREGPILQIAGSIYRVVHKLLPPFWPKVSRRVMLVTGGAAGLSAALALQAAYAADDPCFQKAQSQAALNQCASAAYQRADADLNRLYQLMTARLSTDDAARKRLVDAQRKWLQFRDAECAFQTVRTVGGSVQPMNVSSCLTDLTRERVTDLQKHLDCARVMGEGGACAVPPRR